jgi:hypothetical protein
MNNFPLYLIFTPDFTVASLPMLLREAYSGASWQSRRMRRNNMKTFSRTLAGALGALVLALVLVPNATASCGSLGSPSAVHSNWRGQLGQLRLLRAAYLTVGDEGYREDREDPIVGFWHVKFLAGTTEIDAGYSQWHSDGTEIMNSGAHAPITSNFCLGVWKKVGDCKYKLNHFAISWDPTGQTLIGPVSIREEVTLAPDKNHFSGTFAIEAYDDAGNSLGGAKGNITGTRIDVDTPAEPIF